ncbi:TPA: hypothetical protein ENS27_04120 [bacterium]|nr:hypothetical protein [bacterium]
MPVEILVKAGEHDRELCPVTFTTDVEKLGKEWKDAKSCTVVCPESKMPAQCELNEDGKSIKISMIIDYVKAGTQKKYTLSPEPYESAIKLNHKEGEAIDVLIHDEHVTSYHYNKALLKPFLYPVMGPFGHSVTRGDESPEGHNHDHIHHKSLWVSYGEVNHADFWSEGPEAGIQAHKEFLKIAEGSVFAEIHATNEWITRDRSKKIVEESRYMKFYNLPRSQRIIDMTVTFTATNGDVFFGDTKEAGLISVRVYPTLTVSAPGTGKIENAIGGINENETWGKMAQWCDYSGFVDSNKVGIAIFDHPKNFRYPTYWHVRNYGLMTANIFGTGTFESDMSKDGSWTLKANEKLALNFRTYVHAGDAKDGHVSDKYHDYINPPVVSIV